MWVKKEERKKQTLEITADVAPGEGLALLCLIPHINEMRDCCRSLEIALRHLQGDNGLAIV